jgi:hypothetical protein
MLRLFLFLFLILPISVFAIQHKVVSVPAGQKFNRINVGGAWPAPVPYNQRLMTGGKTFFPTLTDAEKGQIFMRQLNRKFGFQPQEVTKQSIAKTLGKAGKNVAKMHPALRAAAVLSSAYVSNCLSPDYQSLCTSAGGPSEAEVTLDTPHTPAEFRDTVTCNAYFNGESLGTFTGRTFGECLNAGSTAISSKINLPKANETIELSPTSTISISRSFAPFPCDQTTNYCAVGVKITETSSSKNCGGDANGNMTCTKSDPVITVTNIGGSVQLDKKSTNPHCAPESKPEYEYGPYKPAGSSGFRCYKASKTAHADEAFFEQSFAADPKMVDDLINNPDIGLDDFIDPETGAPYDTLFPNPKFDDVSDKFANAAESIINGTAQTTDPSNTQTYIPPDIYNVTVTNVNQWFEGNTFTDTFTQAKVKPDQGDTPEGIPTDWTKFPGLTQKQYETTNERWATGAMSKADNIDNAKTEEQAAFDQFKDFANAPTVDPKFFTLADYVSLPTAGSCRGFTIDAPLTAQPITINVNQHCPPYDAWGRPLVEWFLGILTIIQLFRIFQRTLEVA